ncbi:MAG: hypothetical protein V1721_06235 [Pseudomonadota bacterium]
MGKEIIEEKQNTPDLSQMLAEGRPVFAGTTSNAADAEPGKPALPGPDAAEKAAAAEAKKTAAAEAEKTAAAEAEKTAAAEAEKTAAAEAEKTAAAEAEKAATAEAEKTAAAGKIAGKEGEDSAALKKKEDTPPETALRFKSHEEAERGYKEVQGKATKAEQRASDLERENLALKEERDREKAEKERKTAQAAARTKVLEYGKTRKKQALEAIDKLDPDDPEYRDKAADLLTQADLDIYENYRQNQPAPPAEKPPGEKEAPGTKAKTDAPPDEKETAREHLLGRIKAADIAEDDELFWLFVSQTPSVDEEGKRIDFDRQIDWALERTKTYQSKQEAKIKVSIEKVAGEKGRKKQEEEIPLGRGGNPAGPGAPETGKEKTAEEQKPFGLNDAMDFALSSRRLD